MASPIDEFAGHVLLADDAAAGRGLMVGLLEGLGYAATAVGDGVAAIEAAVAAPGGFGLALIDIDMPRADGPAAARAIRALPDPPPMLGLVAAGRPEEAARATAAGMPVVLQKPVRRAELAAAIDRWYRAPASDSAHVDLAHLARYTLGDAALERELFDLFRENADAYLAQMAAAQADEAWHRAAHTLKGAARGLGATQVAALAQAAEALAGAAPRAAQLRRLRAAVAAWRRAVQPERLAQTRAAASHNAKV